MCIRDRPGAAAGRAGGWSVLSNSSRDQSTDWPRAPGRTLYEAFARPGPPRGAPGGGVYYCTHHVINLRILHGRPAARYTKRLRARGRRGVRRGEECTIELITVSNVGLSTGARRPAIRSTCAPWAAAGCAGRRSVLLNSLPFQMWDCLLTVGIHMVNAPSVCPLKSKLLLL